ncbi:hypothetical protein YC2023_090938 [Brassica napus]
MRISSIIFEMDCSYLVDMTTHLMNWPAFASEINEFRSLHDHFKNVSMLHIPWSINGWADSLAKEAKP